MRAKETAWKPFHKSSELTVGPTNSDLLNSETLLLISCFTLLTVSILSWLFSFCNLIIIVFSSPNSWSDTSLKWGDKIFLKLLILVFLVLTSINVPPLKSIPKFNPLNMRRIIEAIIAIDDNM